MSTPHEIYDQLRDIGTPHPGPAGRIDPDKAAVLWDIRADLWRQVWQAAITDRHAPEWAIAAAMDACTGARNTASGWRRIVGGA